MVDVRRQQTVTVSGYQNRPLEDTVSLEQIEFVVPVICALFDCFRQTLPSKFFGLLQIDEIPKIFEFQDSRALSRILRNVDLEVCSSRKIDERKSHFWAFIKSAFSPDVSFIITEKQLTILPIVVN